MGRCEICGKKLSRKDHLRGRDGMTRSPGRMHQECVGQPVAVRFQECGHLVENAEPETCRTCKKGGTQVRPETPAYAYPDGAGKIRLVPKAPKGVVA